MSTRPRQIAPTATIARWSAAVAVATALLSLVTTTGWGQEGTGEVPANPATAATDPVIACADHLEASWEALDGAEPERAAAELLAADSDGCRELLSTDAEWTFLNGRLALLQGDTPAAVERFEASLRADRVRAGDRPDEGSILYYLGLAQQVRGQRDEALSAYRRLAAEHPAHGRCALVLGLLEGSAATSPAERLAAAEQAVETHNYTAAQRLLTRIVADGVGRAVEPDAPEFQVALADALATGDETLGEAVYQLAYLWYYWIRVHNPQSIPLFQALADSTHERRDDALYYLARATMRAEDYEGSRAAWAAFGDRYPRDSRAHEATYYRGWLYMDRERFEEAIPGFRDYLDDYPRGRRADRAIWYLGWSYYRLGRYSDAREVFHRMAEESGYLFGAKGAYWEARCLAAEGRDEEAATIWRAVADRYAFTYYGLLARQRLGDPLVPEREHTPPAPVMARLGELAADHSGVASLRGLLLADQPYRARRFFDARHPERTVGGAVDTLIVQHAAGDAYRDWRDARDRGDRVLRDAPSDRNVDDWMRSYPRPYAAWVESAGEAFGVDPLLVWSHMQIESHYHWGLVSYADAQGLLQLIPRTGQRVAAALGEPYAEGMLMHPVPNIRYGTWYLAALIEEFSDQLPLAICAYNAGGHNVQRWVDENHDLAFDEFVEEIPFDQSREYLKKVIGIYAHYLFLYGDGAVLTEQLERLFPEAIRAGYRGEIDW